MHVCIFSDAFGILSDRRLGINTLALDILALERTQHIITCFDGIDNTIPSAHNMSLFDRVFTKFEN